MNHLKKDDELKGLEIKIKSEFEIKEEPVENYKEWFCDKENFNSDSLKPQEQTCENEINQSSSWNMSLPVKFEVTNCKMENEDPIENNYEKIMKCECEFKTEKKISLLSLNKDEEIQFRLLEISKFPKVIVRKINVEKEKALLLSGRRAENMEKVKNLTSKTFDEKNLKSISELNSSRKKTKVAQKNRKRYRCSQCDYKTDVKSHFEEHKLIHSNSKIKLFKCDVCNYETNYKWHLKSHLLKHSDEYQLLKCSECEFQTDYKHSLKGHLLNHDKTKLFKCEICKYETNGKSYFNMHMRTHGDDAPFKCTECSFQAKLKSYLSRHLLTHSSSKRFKCTYCNYETNYRAGLRLHVLNHSDSKLYKCFECVYATNNKGHLKDHLLTHSDKKKLKCFHCRYETNFKSQLRKHIRRSHLGR